MYLDNNAATPLDPRVAGLLTQVARGSWANSSSREHEAGWNAAQVVDDARFGVADLVGADPHEIIFTSGATEAINLALRGLIGARATEKWSIVTSPIEHAAVRECCAMLKQDFDSLVTHLSFTKSGGMDTVALAAALPQNRPTLVALALANGEIGTVCPLGEVAALAHQHGALVFTDATQAVGKIPLNFRELGVDLAAFSAHKLYGPKGVGALYIRGGAPKITLKPLIVGGGQERGLRAGTLNVPGIAGFGEACRIAKLEMATEAERVAALRDKLEGALLAALPDAWVNGDRERRLPNTSNIGFGGVDARALIRSMGDIAVSTGSACASASPEPSHVLKALGLTDEQAHSCVRFSLGRFTTAAVIDYAIERVTQCVRALRCRRIAV